MTIECSAQGLPSAAEFDARVASRFAQILEAGFTLHNVVRIVPRQETHTDPDVEEAPSAVEQLAATYGSGHVAVMRAPQALAEEHGLPYAPDVYALLVHQPDQAI